MKKVAVGAMVVALAGVGGLWWWRSSNEPEAAAPDETERPPPVQRGAASDIAATVRPEGDRPPTRVIRLSNAVEQRRQIAERIAAARARRAAATASATTASAAAPSAGGAEMDSPDAVLIQMQEAFAQVKTFVSECVERSGSNVRGFKAELALTGDPDVGTLIDASALVSTEGTPLPAAFDDCVRGVMQTLELPPMGLGAEFKVTYTFAF